MIYTPFSFLAFSRQNTALPGPTPKSSVSFPRIFSFSCFTPHLSTQRVPFWSLLATNDTAPGLVSEIRSTTFRMSKEKILPSVGNIRQTTRLILFKIDYVDLLRTENLIIWLNRIPTEILSQPGKI